MPHDVTRWKRVTYLFLSAVTCGQTDSYSVCTLLCTDVKVADGTMQRVSLLPVRGPNFIFPAWRQYRECNFVFLSVPPGRRPLPFTFCFGSLFNYCRINEHKVGATENVWRNEFHQSSHSLFHCTKKHLLRPLRGSVDDVAINFRRPSTPGLMSWGRMRTFGPCWQCDKYLDKVAAVHWISVTYEIVSDGVGDVNHITIKEDAPNGRVRRQVTLCTKHHV